MTVTANGQTTTTNYSPDSLNQYASVGGQSLQYDNNFNMTAYAGWSYIYDAQNRLLYASSSGHTVQFSYDGLGRCVRRIEDGVTRVFTFDGWRPIEEWNGGGYSTRFTVFGAGIDEPLYRNGIDGEFYYKLDALGNVHSLLKKNGSVAQLVEKYSYDAFGTPTIKDANGNPLNPSNVSSVKNPFMFKGREYLPVMGIYDNRRRMYHPGLGRFLQTDPIGLAGDSGNLYRYCNHNPMLGSDPMGETLMDFGDIPPSDLGLPSDSAPPPSLSDSLYNSNDGVVLDNNAWLVPPESSISPSMFDPSLTIGGFSGSGPDSALYSDVGFNQGGMPDSSGQSLLSQAGNLVASFFNFLRGITIPAPGIGGDAAQETFNQFVNGETLLMTGLTMSSGIVGAGVAAEEGGGTIVVTHFTSSEGVAAIEESGGILRSGTYVTLPNQVSGLSQAEVESALEIQAGRGAFSTTFETSNSNLITPSEGILTSGQKIQFRLANPTQAPPFTPWPK